MNDWMNERNEISNTNLDSPTRVEPNGSLFMTTGAVDCEIDQNQKNQRHLPQPKTCDKIPKQI